MVTGNVEGGGEVEVEVEVGVEVDIDIDGNKRAGFRQRLDLSSKLMLALVHSTLELGTSGLSVAIVAKR